MSYKRISPQPIAEGGTNATTMVNTNGVNYFDGTSIVTTTVGNATEILTSNGVGVAPTFQPLGGGTQLVANHVLTSLQIKDLQATPITMIAAPGAGFILRIIFADSVLNYGGNNAFTTGSSQFGRFVYGTNAAATGGLITGNIFTDAQITSTVDYFRFMRDFTSPQWTTTNGTVSSYENEPITLVLNPSGGPDIGGNAANDNTITVRIIYELVPV